MNNITQAIWAELLKARRSKMPLVTVLAFSLAPFVGGFFMVVLKYFFLCIISNTDTIILEFNFYIRFQSMRHSKYSIHNILILFFNSFFETDIPSSM